MRNMHRHTHTQEQVPTEDLTQSDIDSLLYMYQEEKLAMDVYDTLAVQYDAAIFDKISDAEQKHLSLVENTLLDNGIDLSALQDLDAGEFIDEGLQELYTALVNEGSTSFEDALNVGISIENADITDLQEYLTDENANATVVGVYTNLEKGSEHHLAAFTQVLEIA